MLFKVSSNPDHSVTPPHHSTRSTAQTNGGRAGDSLLRVRDPAQRCRGALHPISRSVLPASCRYRRTCHCGDAAARAPPPCPLPPRRGLQPVSRGPVGTRSAAAGRRTKGAGPESPTALGPPGPRRPQPHSGQPLPAWPPGAAAALTLRVGQGDHGEAGAGSGRAGATSSGNTHPSARAAPAHQPRPPPISSRLVPARGRASPPTARERR